MTPLSRPRAPPTVSAPQAGNRPVKPATNFPASVPARWLDRQVRQRESPDILFRLRLAAPTTPEYVRAMPVHPYLAVHEESRGQGELMPRSSPGARRNVARRVAS